MKTPGGLTDRQTVDNIVLQGDTWGSILASVQVDAIAEEVLEAGLVFQYKNSLVKEKSIGVRKKIMSLLENRNLM